MFLLKGFLLITLNLPQHKLCMMRFTVISSRLSLVMMSSRLPDNVVSFVVLVS